MKRRSTRDRGEAAMRLRNARGMLKKLQDQLDRAGHRPEDPYRKALIAQFWQKVGMDKRLVEDKPMKLSVAAK